MIKRLSALLLALLLALGLSACGGPEAGPPPSASPAASAAPAPLESPDSPVQAESPSPELPAEPSPEPSPSPTVAEDGWYSSKEDVALYVHLYGHLPDNYVTKREAQDLGWTGGSRFGNYEGLLPEADGRVYTECDIGTVGRSSRGGQRLVFSNDGLIYYTGDHYESFELLYGEP